ncbi:SDR family NAD(P)-dependent oxidoreductase [Lactobacillus rodentium]|uniref:3-oxoacyl-ACP reductase n=1 Tax=Lactobacillus rodentium TaxID=947835 RepID=A0A2Z6T9R6_9LACO|nr:SDR family NAD(P)-dependent oxidoreductase [Lactobacillus rodentium]MCR1895085.1 SDR family NAD(P)-dependent oxidoreductase [Lactobacillus rodentium]GBG05378.1 3-oxoacyl-ACP reductase [Lactobacillus rodentium]
MKRAVIFGATGGIGKEIALDLAKAGWSLYLHFDKSKHRALALQKQLIKLYPQQEFFLLHLSFLDQDKKLLNLDKTLFPINALIFAQGITDYDFLGNQSLKTIDNILKVNLITPIKLTRLLEPLLLKHEHSRIIYLGSVYGQQGSALESVYSASKGGITRFAQAYAREVAASKLTVNVLAPGAVNTPMNEIFSTEILNQVRDEIPANRLANPQDISFWVENLLAPQSDYLTGQTIYIDGGWLV